MYTYEVLQLIPYKNAFGQLTKLPEFKGNILNSVIGIAWILIKKKVLLVLPIINHKVLGTILQFAITL
jgi:hypothetical protein